MNQDSRRAGEFVWSRSRIPPPHPSLWAKMASANRIRRCYLTRPKSLACLVAIVIMSGMLLLLVFPCKQRDKVADDTILVKSIQEIGPWPLDDRAVFVNDSIAKNVRRQARIFCWMTSRQTSRAKLLAVNSTWAQRCDAHVFVVTSAGRPLPPGSLDLGVPDGRNNLVAKTKRMITWIYKNVVDEYDWFLKADDDTYVVMENLRFLLMHFDPKSTVYIGHPFKYGPGYNSGGAGYVLSKSAIKRLVLEGFQGQKVCNPSLTAEDMFVGQCMRALNVSMYESRDRFRRDTFLPLSPRTTFMGPLSTDITEYEWVRIPLGPTCCSQLLISMHYITPEMMYLLEFALYRMAVYGRVSPPELFRRFFTNDTLDTRRPYINSHQQGQSQVQSQGQNS